MWRTTVIILSVRDAAFKRKKKVIVVSDVEQKKIDTEEDHTDQILRSLLLE